MAKHHRCELCRRKLILLDTLIVCKCDKNYCAVHRLPETHNCNCLKEKEPVILEKVVKDKLVDKI